MAKNITLMGASYSAVPAVTLPKTGGGTARFDDASVTTATAADVASGKVFLAADGQVTTGTASGGGSTLITKSITANGTYDAEDDSADGYSSVTVNVPTGGGASNYVTGTFTGTTKGGAIDVILPYTGNGYPIAAMIYVKGGAYDSEGEGSTFYNTIQRYAVAQWTLSKSRIASTPTYIGSGGNNYACLTWIYKSSTSSATTYSRSSNMNTADAYLAANATSSNTHIVTFWSSTKMSVYIASNSYGFMANIPYTYHIIYSS